MWVVSAGFGSLHLFLNIFYLYYYTLRIDIMELCYCCLVYDKSNFYNECFFNNEWFFDNQCFFNNECYLTNECYLSNE